MSNPLVLTVSATTRREAETRSWDWVEGTVWTERMLAALDNGVQGGRWYSLMDKVYALPTLRAAWEQVKANQGAAGVDRITVERFEAQAERYLIELHGSLKAGTYRPEPVRRVYVPKPGGGERPLGIPTVKDRIVQTALKFVLEPIFEREFLPTSYGFRPGRGCKDAPREVDGLIKEGYVYVVDADLKSYFDTIPKDRLMAQVRARISDGRVLDLVRAYLDQEVIAGLERWTPTAGTPQGAVLSPLLANLYLHELDQAMAERGHRMVRYADDFVILCRTLEEAEAALRQVREWTEDHGLVLHPDKTHLGNCRVKGQGFEFLGYRFEAGRRRVRRKSLKAFKDKIREKTRRNRPGSMKEIAQDLNRSLRGWFGYFQQAVPWTFKDLDGFIRRRLRAILLRRHHRSGWGKSLTAHHRWPNAYFANLGLFTLSEAWAVARQSRCGNC